jgi:hypothetical protein
MLIRAAWLTAGAGLGLILALHILPRPPVCPIAQPAIHPDTVMVCYVREGRYGGRPVNRTTECYPASRYGIYRETH